MSKPEDMKSNANYGGTGGNATPLPKPTDVALEVGRKAKLIRTAAVKAAVVRGPFGRSS